SAGSALLSCFDRGSSMAVTSLEDHPLIRALTGGPSAAQALQELGGPLPDEQELDSLAEQDASFHVLDADADQRLCLETARRGTSLVVTGAPGTGKRQTVVNLITDFLGRGRKVLCVGPKPAALQAIAERLRQLGLAAWFVRPEDQGNPGPRMDTPAHAA